MSFEVTRSSSASIATLKQAVKADAAWIRSEKSVVHQLQRTAVPKASLRQSALDKTRFMARARLVVYGLLRGRTWAEIESSHPDGDAHLAYALARVWTDLQRAFDEPVAVPEPLRVHLSPWARP